MYRGASTPTTDPPTGAECNTEAEATAGMGTATRMTRARAAAKNAFTEPPSTAPPAQLAAPPSPPPQPPPPPPPSGNYTCNIMSFNFKRHNNTYEFLQPHNHVLQNCMTFLCHKF